MNEITLRKNIMGTYTVYAEVNGETLDYITFHGFNNALREAEFLARQHEAIIFLVDMKPALRAEAI